MPGVRACQSKVCLSQLVCNSNATAAAPSKVDGKEEYFFTHRNQTEFLEWHLKKGTGHNEITTLRIYFFYDEKDGMVIIGHLTSHLTNAMS